MTTAGFICAPAVTVPGVLVVQRVDGDLFVTHADPRIWISAELVADFRAGCHHPHTRLAGDVLTVDAVNRRVVYVLREYLFAPDCWLAEWPD